MQAEEERARQEAERKKRETEEAAKRKAEEEARRKVCNQLLNNYSRICRGRVLHLMPA